MAENEDMSGQLIFGENYSNDCFENFSDAFNDQNTESKKSDEADLNLVVKTDEKTTEDDDANKTTNENGTIIVLDDSFTTSNSHNKSSSSSNSSTNTTTMEYEETNEQESESVRIENQKNREEYYKNLLIVDQKVMPGSPSFSINVKTGSWIIRAKTQEDIKKVEQEFNATRSRLLEKNISITPESFRSIFFSTKTSEPDSTSLTSDNLNNRQDSELDASEIKAKSVVIITEEIISKSLQNLQLLKDPSFKFKEQVSVLKNILFSIFK